MLVHYINFFLSGLWFDNYIPSCNKVYNSLDLFQNAFHAYCQFFYIFQFFPLILICLLILNLVLCLLAWFLRVYVSRDFQFLTNMRFFFYCLHISLSEYLKSGLEHFSPKSSEDVPPLPSGTSVAEENPEASRFLCAQRVCT